MGGEINYVSPYYGADIYDYSDDHGCDAVSDAYYMGTATYADFMGEAFPNVDGLPEFYAFEVFQGAYVDSYDNWNGIDNSPVTASGYPASVFDYISLTQDSSNVTNWCNTLSYEIPVNVCPGTVNSSDGSFYETWDTSDGF